MHSLTKKASFCTYEHKEKLKKKQIFSLQGFKGLILRMLGLDGGGLVCFHFLFGVGKAGSVLVQEGGRYVRHTDTPIPNGHEEQMVALYSVALTVCVFNTIYL